MNSGNFTPKTMPLIGCPRPARSANQRPGISAAEVQFDCSSSSLSHTFLFKNSFLLLGHSGSDETSNNTMAALLFHPPQYQCVICQHNASLYRALSNPSLFSRKPPTHSSSTSAAANTSCVSTTMTPTHTPAASGQTGSGQLRNKHSTSVNSSAAKNDKKYEGTIINSSTNNHDTDPDEEVIKECEVVII